MLYLSEVLMQHPEVESLKRLLLKSKNGRKRRCSSGSTSNPSFPTHRTIGKTASKRLSPKVDPLKYPQSKTHLESSKGAADTVSSEKLTELHIAELQQQIDALPSEAPWTRSCTLPSTAAMQCLKVIFSIRHGTRPSGSG